MNSFKSILFDLDGTLIDSLGSVSDSIKIVLMKAGYRTDINSRKLIGPPIREIFSSILPELNGKMINDLIVAYRKEYDSEGWKNTKLFDHVPMVLDDLHSLRKLYCYLVTNKPHIPTSNILKLFNIAKYFEDAVSPDTFPGVGISKSELVSELIQKHNIDVSESVFVGDSQLDAKAAYENKICFVAVSYGYGSAHLQNRYPRFGIISNISEIFNFVR